MDIKIKPIDRAVGKIDVPGDKSISHRAVMIGAIANGKTIANNFLKGEDCLHTVEAFKKMGVGIKTDGKKIEVSGAGLKGLKKPQGDLYLGNSGTTMRLISGILAGQDFEVTLTGDESLSKRPMKRVMEPLREMGATIDSVKGDGCAPLKIKGGHLKPIEYKTKVASAQVKSCILLAGLYAKGRTHVEEPFQSRDHTERMLEFFGADIKKQGTRCSVNSPGTLAGKKLFIPGDISSGAFFMVLAALLDGSEVTISSLGMNPTRRGVVDVLKRMGADISISNLKEELEPICDLKVRASRLKCVTIRKEEIPLLIDEIPILAVAAAQAEGRTEISGVEELRVKETDRVFSIVDNLTKMGVDITSDSSGIKILGKRKRFLPAVLKSYGDHRTAMSMAVAACVSTGECRIEDIDCVNTSFPHFFDILNFLKR